MVAVTVSSSVCVVVLAGAEIVLPSLPVSDGTGFVV